MTKLPGILLLFCLWAPFAATYSWLHIEKKQVKREIKQKLFEGLEKSELTLVKIATARSSAQLDWREPGEFEYRGHMYDVVEIEVRDDSTYYWCWLDEEETQLNRQLYLLVARALGNNPRHRENQQRLISFIQQLYYSSPWQWRLSLPVDGLSGGTNFYVTTGYYPFNPLAPPKPPPEII